MRIKLATIVAVLVAVGLSYVAGPLRAQFVPPLSTQFDITGFLQEATLDGQTVAGKPALQGGHLKVNGHVVTVPANTIVILPANALTWQELFAQAPPPYGIGNTTTQTGLAMADVPSPLTTYEVQVVGNRIGNTYIAGLIYLSQNGLNSGAGYINFINYTTGEFRVGGTIGSATTGTRVQLNDPAGRYGRVVSPDIRFTVDADNPTIAAGTGFPMCIPRTDPAGPQPEDGFCPQSQRSVPAPVNGVYASVIQMNDPGALPGVAPDATIQAPFEVGDYVTFAGTLVTDNAAAPTQGPWPAGGTANTYISAHTVTNNVAIYTWPGTKPAYVSTEVALIGTGGLTVIGAGEAAIRTRFEGMTTDPSRNIHLYGMDLDPATGIVTDRDWGMIGVDPGPPNGAVKGRWRFRPPCTAPLATPTDKACSPAPAGTFLPPTREVRAVVEGAWVPGQTTTYANGIIAGQYHAPILEYIFPENVPGAPIVPNNFEAIDFLAFGGYISAGGTLAGQLNPWPGAAAPVPACVLATANAGGPYTAVSGATVTLNGSATGTTPNSFSWSASAGSFVANAATASPSYKAPVVSLPTTVNVSLFVTNCGGVSAPVTTTITVNPATVVTVNPVAPKTVSSGQANVTLTATGSPAGITFVWTQTSGTPVVLSANGPGSVKFNAPLLPPTQVVPSVLGFTVTGSFGGATASTSTTVTVNPLADVVTIATTEYRTSKQRLVITASSTNANATLTLQPYRVVSGAIFDPGAAAVFTNIAGVITLTLVGAPPPDCNGPAGVYATPCSATPLTVKSNFGGVSLPRGLDKIRQ